MTVFVRVFDGCPAPREEEVADASADGDGRTQPQVERHEDEHKEIADDGLDDVQERLQQV